MAGIRYQDITQADKEAFRICAPAKITYGWGVEDSKPIPPSSKESKKQKKLNDSVINHKYIQKKKEAMEAMFDEMEKQAEMKAL